MLGSPAAADASSVPCHDQPSARAKRAAPARGRHGADPGARRAHPQPQEHRPRHPEEPARRHHRPVGIGQVEPGVRHALRGGPAPLRREPVGVRAPVPAADGQARRRRHRGPVAGDLDRAEGDLAQPALDRRHRHRDPRLPAPAVRARRHAVLPEPRPRAAGAERQPDGRRDPRVAPGDAPDGARAGRARPQGRVRRAVRADAGAGLRALSRRRRHRRRRRRAEAEEGREARHRRRHRPHQGAGDGRRRRRRAAAPAPRRELRGGAAHRRRARARRRDG